MLVMVAIIEDRIIDCRLFVGPRGWLHFGGSKVTD